MTSRLDMALQRARTARRTFPCAPLPPAGHRVPVLIVGAGPVGLAAAADLRLHGIDCLVLEKHASVSDGSRAICWAKRTLEICNRLGVAERMLAKGVTWNLGKVFVGDRVQPLYTFDLLPLKDQQFPAFINLQQYYVEEYLADALAGGGDPVLRQHAVVALQPLVDGVRVGVETPLGSYEIDCDWLIAADGSRSTVRELLGLAFEGRTFEDNFLIADVRVDAPFPAERRFYFQAPFNANRTALMHRQPDNVWRLDFQLGWDIDREAAVREDNVTRLVQSLLGPDIAFEYEWVSLYTFQCRRMRQFVHDRVIFVGDAAHLVSPFGARGANGGLQDVDNLAWKLAATIKGTAGPGLLRSYDTERVHAADENIINSTRATDFITPKTAAAAAFGSAVIGLAGEHAFARAFVNSGRLSVPCHQRDSSLTTPDEDLFHASVQPGDACVDAPVVGQGRWLMPRLGGEFTCLYFAGEGAPGPAEVRARLPRGVRLLAVGAGADEEAINDPGGLLAQRYDGAPGAAYLIRPDQHVAARWRTFDPGRFATALARATGHHIQTPRSMTA